MEINLVEKKKVFSIDDFNIDLPWSPSIYFSVRGAENFHIYLWIAKDLGSFNSLVTELTIEHFD